MPGNCAIRIAEGHPARFLLVLLLTLAACDSERADRGSPNAAAEEAVAKKVEIFCSSCHGFAPPDSLPRRHWAAKVQTMYEFAAGDAQAGLAAALDMQEVIAYFEKNAPEALPGIASSVGRGPGPIQLSRVGVQLNPKVPFPGVSQVDVQSFEGSSGFGPHVVFCEMKFGVVGIASFDPAAQGMRVEPLVRARHPAYAEVVDLDDDGLLDLLVADLGHAAPTDDLAGSLEFFRRLANGKYEKQTLLDGVGRISEARSADFDGDGDLDIICAIFGWRKVGGIVYLENEAARGEPPRFKVHEIDPRSGAINLPVCDIDGDGRLDFFALISQHHESIYAYLNRGPGQFEARLIYRAPHANWGSVELELVDLDKDGDLDLLYAHGDTLDDHIGKPYHGVNWLENRGALEFRDHPLTKLYGAYAARAGDLDGDGDLDVVVSAFLPSVGKNEPALNKIESLIWLEQKDGMRFERHSLETSRPYHPCLEVADVDGDGRDDIIYGNMTLYTGDDWRFENSFVVLRNTPAR